ncbi:MAG: hypothetical protein JJU27_13985 [Gammaproteobacteria bacterium]|nr:hypothetical protein [Gammaproteobacteria bacterium]
MRAQTGSAQIHLLDGGATVTILVDGRSGPTLNGSQARLLGDLLRLFGGDPARMGCTLVRWAEFQLREHAR